VIFALKINFCDKIFHGFASPQNYVRLRYLRHQHTEFELTGKNLRGVLERPKFSRPDKNPWSP